MQRSSRTLRFTAEDGRVLELRVPRKGDLDALLKFANAIAREKRSNRDLGIIAFDRRFTRKEEREFLSTLVEGAAKKEMVAFAAFDRGKMVGNCDIRRRKPSDVHHSGLLGIVILDGYRGVGVGEALMRAALSEARRMGMWLVELTVLAINPGAIHLYEKLGFVRVGDVPGKVLRDGRHIDEVVMYADLRKR